MLNITQKSSVQSPHPRTVTGRWLAHAKLTATERAFLAADIVAGRVVVVNPTLKQAACQAGVSAVYAAAARDATPAEREAIESGGLSIMELIETAPVVTAWKTSTAADRVALVKKIGPDAVWAALAEAV